MPETPNDYQRQFFFASNGHYPKTNSEQSFAASVLPFSPEDAAWRHVTGSASYANEVVIALQQGKIQEAQKRLHDFREEGIQTRGFGKEALTKLQAVGIIDDIYNSDLIVPLTARLSEIRFTLEEIMRTPRPMLRK